MKNLIEKIEYCLQYPEEEEKLREMFLPTEWDVLSSMKKYKQRVRQIEKEGLGEERTAEYQLERMDAEKEAILDLKEKMLKHLDILLATETAEAWCEMLVWYRFVIQEKLAARFWEFYVLKTVLDIFLEECRKETEISVLSLHSMKEMSEVYFRTVFLLRRLEYEVEPMDEWAEYAKGRKLSDTFLQRVLKEAQIYDKNKVKRMMEGWKRDES